MSQQTPQKSLYITIETYDVNSKQIGRRVVNIYHPGTNKWLQKHSWWAAHHNNLIEIRNSDKGEIQAHLEAVAAEEAAKKKAA